MMRAKKRVPELICDTYVLLMLSVYLLSFPPAGFTAMVAHKYRLFLCFTIPFCASMLLLELSERLQRKRAGKRHDLFARFLLAYLLFTAISALVSPYDGTFFGNMRKDGFFTVLLYGLTALFLSLDFRPKLLHAHALGLAIVLMCVLGLVQLFDFNPLGLFPKGYTYYDTGDRFSGQYWGTIGNVDLCVCILCAAAALFLSLLVCNSEKQTRWLWLPLSLSVFCALSLRVQTAVFTLLALLLLLLPPFLSTSMQRLYKLLFAYGVLLICAGCAACCYFYRGVRLHPTAAGPLALWAGGFLFFIAAVFVNRRKDARPKHLRGLLLCVSGAIVLVGLVLVYCLDKLPLSFLQDAHDLLHGKITDKLGSRRIYIWRQVLQAIRQRPFFGGGPDTLAQRGLKGVMQYNSLLDMYFFRQIDAAHNEYLNIWVNQGGLALLSYLAVLFVSLKRFWKRTSEPAVACSGAVALSYCVSALFGISMCLNTFLLWLAIGTLNRAEAKDSATA